MNTLPIYPLLALVGQTEMKTALVLALINPAIGGVLLSGPYGVGKTTAVRGLLDLMPPVERSICDQGCLPGDGEEPCADCQERLARGEPITRMDVMRLIELPLNARLEDVIGGINERVALEQQRVLLEEGILARAHSNLLYVDEINLLDPAVVDAILDAAAQGRTFVRRGPLIRLYPSRFVLVGSMNPEEGELRPQILDRLGLRVWVAPLCSSEERLEVYRRAATFRRDPIALRASYADQTARLREEIVQARQLLPQVILQPAAEELAITVIQELGIPSHRAEIVTLEAARARAAADGRSQATPADVAAVAPLALRWRRRAHLEAAAAATEAEDRAIREALERHGIDLPAGGW
ncbi:MAG: magnesium chelatase [Herpetosiphonaceae bacterium]|nr:MAG: magnesium chelatase [Herpetosiphonaceae bacterium]